MLFAITCFLSSSLLYNTIGAIDEKAVEKLGMIAKVFELFKIGKKTKESQASVQDEIAQYFP